MKSFKLMTYKDSSRHEAEQEDIPAINDIETTEDIKIAYDPMDQVIGQERAINFAGIAAIQRRHLLLIGPPGIGKSMIARALAKHLQKPKQEIAVVHNQRYPERPFVDVVNVFEKDKTKSESKNQGYKNLLEPHHVPLFVAERLGFRCKHCGYYSDADQMICLSCGQNKYGYMQRKRKASPIGDMITEIFEINSNVPEDRIKTNRLINGIEEEVIYQRHAHNKVRMFRSCDLENIKKSKYRKVIVPIERNNFIEASGASETELLGDIRHDPYGGDIKLGTPPYLRVIAGAIHEAHEGVLFIDEISRLQYLQDFILTALQEKRFTISGRNPTSSGAIVRVDNVPCDFVLIAAGNIHEMQSILPALRSRILGNGYEILLNTSMPDNQMNRIKMAKFTAQEIKNDGKIPDATKEAIDAIIEESRRRALKIDNAKNSLSLRLRDLGGIIRLSGDIAHSQKSEYIEREHIIGAIEFSKPIEQQIKERYGTLWSGAGKDSNIETGGEEEVDKSYQ